MSVHSTNYVLHRKYGNPTRKLIMVAIADFANDRGEAWPSIDTLADRAECSRRSVQDHIRILVAEGELVIDPNAGRRGTHLYRILFKNSEASEVSEQGVQNLHGGVQITGGKTARGGANHRRQSAPEPLGTIKNHQEGGEESPRPSMPSAMGSAPPEREEILQHLAAIWPHAPQTVVGRESTHLAAALPLLASLLPADWTALLAWTVAPNRVRGRKLWPRDRAEFIEHTGQAIEAVRKWWHAGGAKWWAVKNMPTPISSAAPPKAKATAHYTREELESFLKI